MVGRDIIHDHLSRRLHFLPHNESSGCGLFLLAIIITLELFIKFLICYHGPTNKWLPPPHPPPFVSIIVPKRPL